MHNSEFSVGGGPLEVLSKLPKRHALERHLERRLFERRPQGAVLVDNGEINLRLASLLRFFDVPVVYYIPPKVWAWRMSRMEDLAQHTKLVLSILPFEEPLYKEWGVPFQYVGNPLLDEINFEMTPEQAKRRLQIDPELDVLGVLPGSRHTEIRHHVEVFSEAIKQMVSKLEVKPVIVVPAAQAIDVQSLSDALKTRLAGFDVRVFKGQSHEVLRASRAALVKSGTSTLEAALIGTPMVLAYASSKSAAWLYKHVVRYKGFVGLVNLFLSDDSTAALGWTERLPEPVVPELVLKDCTASNIARALERIYVDGAERQKMLAQLAKTKGRLCPPAALGTSPSQAAAEAVWQVFNSREGLSGV